jgi:hypothetical protein
MNPSSSSQPHVTAPPPYHCARCGKPLSPGRAFAFKPPASPQPGGSNAGSETLKCLGCSLRHLPMLKRSLLAALVVGTVLTALNQGDILLAGQWQPSFYWKIPLTYCVPLIVATYGALTNSRK